MPDMQATHQRVTVPPEASHFWRDGRRRRTYHLSWSLGKSAMDLARYLLLENPLTLWILLGIAAVVAGLAWMRTGSRRAARAALGCLAAGVLVGVLAWAVETDRERLLRTLDTMAKAVDRGDAEALIECISPEYRSGPSDKAALAAIVRLGLQRVRATAETPVIRQRDREACVTQAYTFRPAPGARPVPAEFERVTWEGAFAPDPDGEWRLRAVAATQPLHMTPEEAARHLPKAQL